MATIAINGIILEPQPAWDVWEIPVVSPLLNGTDHIGAFRIFKMRSPSLAGQTFNWEQFENQILLSLQTYEPGKLPTSANITYTTVIARQIQRWESPIDRSINGVELSILVNVEDVGS